MWTIVTREHPELPEDVRPPELPRTMRMAWGRLPEGTRGPRRGLTVEKVVEAAIAVADEEGLAALSMSRVAKRLGFTTMSLYRYVDSKDDLLELMMDAVPGSPPDIGPEVGWREGLRQWAMAYLARILEHVWFVDLPIKSAPLGPSSMRWLECALRMLGPTGLPAPQKIDMISSLSLYVFSRARVLRDLRDGTEVDYPALLSQVLDRGEFPAIYEAIEEGAWDGPELDSSDPADPDWEEHDLMFGLDRMLDGYEVFVERWRDEGTE